MATYDEYIELKFNYKFCDNVIEGKKHAIRMDSSKYETNFDILMGKRIKASDENLYKREVDIGGFCPPIRDERYSHITLCLRNLIMIRGGYLNNNRYLLTKMFRSKILNIEPSLNYLEWNFGCYKNGEKEQDDNPNIINCFNMLKEYKFPDANTNKKIIIEEPGLSEFYHAHKTPNLIPFKVPQDLKSLMWLINHGYPIFCGIVMFNSAVSKDNYTFGTFTTPILDSEKSIGSHCVLIVGYNQDKKFFILMNTISSNWGVRGRGVIPYDYILDPRLAGDFWTITCEGYL